MLTSLKLAIAAATAAATGGYAVNGLLAADQPAPSPKSEGYEWKLAGQDDKAYSYAAQDSRLDKKVSVNIDGTVAEAAKWLTSQGISFVISDANLSQKKIMINMVDQPLRDAVQAIGDALGGTWSKRGNVYVFQGGHQMFFDMKEMPKVDVEGFRWDPKDMKNLELFIPKLDGKAFTFVAPGGQHKLSESEKKQIEKSMKQAREEMKRAREEMKKVFESKEWKDAKGHKLSDKEKLEVEKAMKQAQEEMKKAFEGNHFKEMKDFKGMSPKEKAELEKEMQKLHLDLKKSFDGMHFKELRDFKGMSPKEKADLEREMQKLRLDLKKSFEGKEFKELKELGGKGFMLNGANIKELIKSLTPAQKELQKKQGYLNFSDLTPAQQKMLGGFSGSGSFTISFSENGEKITIKGGK